MTIDLANLDTKSSLSGTEQILLNDGGTPKDVTVDTLLAGVVKAEVNEVTGGIGISAGGKAANFSLITVGENGSFPTLEAAISAAGTGDYICVLDDLTISPVAGTTQYVINKALTIDFRSGPGRSNRRIINNGDGDVFSSSIPIGSNGQVNGVRILGLHITRTAEGRSAGRAINMHGAFHWVIEDYQIAKHGVGVYLDASPYPSGQCSHNVFSRGLIVGCAIGVHNTGNANINTWHSLNTANCDVHVDHTSGLNPTFFGLRCENLSLRSNPLIYARSQGLQIYGLHMEAKNSVGALTLGNGSIGTVVFGDIYVDGGTRFDIHSSARYHLAIKNIIPMSHGANRASESSQVRAPSVSANTTVTVFHAPIACTIRAISLVNNGFVNYAAGVDFWTVRFEEWNGNVKVADIGTYTQSAQIGLGRVGLTGLDYALNQDRTVRAVFTKTGAPSSFADPLVNVEYGTYAAGLTA